MLSEIATMLTDWRVSRAVRAYAIAGRYRRIYHHHIRKTAGTSLNSAFWGLAGLDLRQMGRRQRVVRDGYVFVRNDPGLIAQGAYFFANSHHPAHALRLPEDTFTVTVLRDPLARVLSHYRYLIWARDDPGAGAREPFLSGLQAEIGWLGRTFADFLARIPREHLLRQLYTFSPGFDVDEAAAGVLACDAVGFTESFADDIRCLGERLGLPLDERREREFVQRIAPADAELAAAREMLAPEYALLARVREATGRSNALAEEAPPPGPSAVSP